MNSTALENRKFKWILATPLVIALSIVVAFFTVYYFVLAEFALYGLVACSFFLYIFNRNPYNCLNFFIIWLPLQTFVLSYMSASDIISNNLISFLAALKEVALLMLLIILSKKRMILRGRLLTVDYLLLLYIALILTYFVLPYSVLGVSGALKVKIFGLRFHMITLLIFLVGRSVPYNRNCIAKAIKLLGSICVLVVIFGVIEILFISRQSLMSGYSSLNILKGGADDIGAYLYIVEFGSYKFERMMSVFLSPLGLAYFLIFPFAYTLSAIKQKKTSSGIYFSRPFIHLVLIGLAILLSITRGVIVASIFSVVVIFFNRHFIKTFVILGFSLLLLTISPLKSVFSETINLEDPSSAAHAYAYVLGLESVLNHPFGIGLGQAGPISALIGGSQGIYGGDDASVGESLYLSMAMEIGLIGVVNFILFVGYIAQAGKRVGNMSSDSTFSMIGNAIFASTVTFMIASIPTELWLGFQASAIYWWFAGLVVQLSSRA